MNGLVTSHYGITGVEPHTNWGFGFQPRCASGPSYATFTLGFDSGIKVKLERTGANYHGSTSGQLGYTCASHPMTTTASITIHVTKAGAVDGAWRVLRFAGTLTFDSAAQLGCRSGHEAELIKGVLVP